jgi:hypothetical protein
MDGMDEVDVMDRVDKKKPPRGEAFSINSGDDLRSHTVSRAVSSALEGLTSVFGMGTGVAPPPWSPEKLDREREKGVDGLGFCAAQNPRSSRTTD